MCLCREYFHNGNQKIAQEANEDDKENSFLEWRMR